MKALADTCFYSTAFIRAFHQAVKWAGGRVHPDDEIIVAICGLLIGGAVTIAIGGAIVELVRAAFGRMIGLPDDWIGKVSDDR